MYDDEMTVKENFIDYIDHEIDYLQKDIQRPGWTQWALVGSLAGLSWLILTELQNIVIFPKINISFSLIIISLLYEFSSHLTVF